jgi:hypothetical protein
MAVRMPDDDGRTLTFVLDYSSNIRGEIMQRQICHGPSARADPARLRPENAKTTVSKHLSDDAIIFGASAKRRQDHDDGPGSLRNHLNVDISPVDHKVLW